MRAKFQELVQSRIIILDGATGTELTKAGMPSDACTEQWVLDNPDKLIELQQAYCEAGSDIVFTCTFGANRKRLEYYGLDQDVREMNRELARISRRAVPNSLVFGDIAPSGNFIEPLGDLPFHEAISSYQEQVRGLLDAGVDGFVVETMIDIQEARAAMLAIRELSDLPVMVSITLDQHGRCLTGAELITAVITLQSLGADAVGCNCSTGPADMISHIRNVKPHAAVPLLAKPNAGMPTVGDTPSFDIGAEEFASFVPEFVRRGVNILGGCCGTDPDFIRMIKQKADACTPIPPAVSATSAVTSASQTVHLGLGRPLTIIGERINPTGKKKLQSKLRKGDLDLVRRYALEQLERGASILDVNVSAPGIDEEAVMPNVISTLSELSRAPLCIDTPNPKVLERALQIYPGRALVNSISAEKQHLEENLAITARYGAMIIALPMSDDGLPPDVATRQRSVEKIIEAATGYGYGIEDIVVDGMLLSASSNPEAAREFLQMVDWTTQELKTNSVVGLSNISFGLPGRAWINGALLTMAVSHGLSTAIANPSSKLVMAMKYAADLLNGRDEYCMNYIRYYRAILKTHSVVMNGEEADYQGHYRPEPGATLDDISEPDKKVEEALTRRNTPQ